MILRFVILILFKCVRFFMQEGERFRFFFHVEDKYPLQDLPDGGNMFGFERKLLFLQRRVCSDPAEYGVDLWRDLIFSLGDTSIAENTIFVVRKPTYRSDRLPALLTFLEIGENTAELEEPGLEINAGEVQISSGFE